MLNAADKVRNLVVSEKNDTVMLNGDSSKTNENCSIQTDDSHLEKNRIIYDEFIVNTVVSSDCL